MFISQVLKYANACMEYRDFVVHLRNVIEKNSGIILQKESADQDIFKNLQEI